MKLAADFVEVKINGVEFKTFDEYVASKLGAKAAPRITSKLKKMSSDDALKRAKQRMDKHKENVRKASEKV